MTEIEKLLAEERTRSGAGSQSHRVASRRSVIALTIGAVAAAALVLSGGVLAIGASATIAATTASSPAADTDSNRVTASVPFGNDTATTPPAATLADDVAEPLGNEPLPDGAVALAPGGTPIYDRHTDRSLIPLPPADWPQSELDNAGIWIDQQYIVAECMAEQGFEYTFMVWYEGSNEDARYTGPPKSEEWKLALGGNTGGGEDYHWDEAGCHGYAVHVTGMDDAN